MKLVDKALSFEGFVAAIVFIMLLIVVSGFVNEQQTKGFKQECIKHGKVYFMKRGTPGSGSYEEGCR